MVPNCFEKCISLPPSKVGSLPPAIPSCSFSPLSSNQGENSFKCESNSWMAQVLTAPVSPGLLMFYLLFPSCSLLCFRLSGLFLKPPWLHSLCVSPLLLCVKDNFRVQNKNFLKKSPHRHVQMLIAVAGSTFV